MAAISTATDWRIRVTESTNRADRPFLTADHLHFHPFDLARRNGLENPVAPDDLDHARSLQDVELLLEREAGEAVVSPPSRLPSAPWRQPD